MERLVFFLTRIQNLYFIHLSFDDNEIAYLMTIDGSLTLFHIDLEICEACLHARIERSREKDRQLSWLVGTGRTSKVNVLRTVLQPTIRLLCSTCNVSGKRSFGFFRRFALRLQEKFF